MFAPDCVVRPVNGYCCLGEVVNVDIARSLGVHFNVDNLLCNFGKVYGFIYEVNGGDQVLTWRIV